MKKYIIYLGAFLLCCLSNKAQALSTYNLNMSNDLGTWTGSGSGYGSVELWLESGGLQDGLHVKVSANTSYFTEDTTSGMAWDAFYFNLSDTTINTLGIQTTDFIFNNSGTWDVDFEQNKNKSYFNVSMFGNFENEVTGTAGVNGANPLEFYIANTSLSIADMTITNDEGWIFTGHLRNFDDKTNLDGETITSTWLATGSTPVPEPATMLLFGTGIAGLTGISLKKRKKV